MQTYDLAHGLREEFARRGFPEKFREPWESDKHPRGQPENAGEFAPKGGGSQGNTYVRPPGTHTSGFVSPETDSGLGTAEAAQRMHNERQGRFLAKAKVVAESLGMKADASSAIGDWHEPGGVAGSEPTAVVELEGAQNYDDAKFYMAIMARYGRQIAMIPFHDDPEGEQALYSFDVKDSVEGIQKTLDDNGVAYRTIQQVGDVTRVYAFAEDRFSLDDKLAKVANHYGLAKISKRRGHGEIFPPIDKTGGDRDAAQRELESYIASENERRGVRGYHKAGADHWLYSRRGAAERLAEQFRRIEAERLT
jgi:hypothetical protein